MVESRKQRFTTIILAKDLNWAVRCPRAVVVLNLSAKTMQGLPSKSSQRLNWMAGTYWCGRTVSLHRERTKEEEGHLQPLVVVAVLATGIVQSAVTCSLLIGVNAASVMSQSQSLQAKVAANLESNLG